MTSLLQLFIDNLLPIFLVAGIGFVLQRKLNINPRPFSKIIFNALTPTLIFKLLVDTDIQAADMGRMVVLALFTTLSVGLIAWLVSKALRLPVVTASAFVLTVIGMNAGNFGLSVNYFAFGDEALAWAIIFFVTNSLFINSAGVYIATVGKLSPQKALRGLLKVPAVYTIPLAFIVRAIDFDIPIGLWRPIELLSGAAIPCMLLILGMQIGNNGFPKRLGLIGLSSAIRLLVSPAIAYFLAQGLGITGAAFQAGITEAAVPTAVITSIIALEFDVDPGFVTGTILVSTLLSPLTLTPILALLGA